MTCSGTFEEKSSPVMLMSPLEPTALQHLQLTCRRKDQFSCFFCPFGPFVVGDGFKSWHIWYTCIGILIHNYFDSNFFSKESIKVSLLTSSFGWNWLELVNLPRNPRQETVTSFTQMTIKINKWWDNGVSACKWQIQSVTAVNWVHYNDVIMGAIASQMTSLTIIYSTVYSGADQSKHQSSASLAFVWGIHRGPVNSSHKWPVTRKIFPFDDVIMENLS